MASAPEFAAGYLLEGIALSRLGRYTEAVRPLEEAVSRAPDDADARYRLAEAHYGRGAYEEARAGAREAVARRPDLAAAAVLVADASRQLGRLAEARAWYLRARADERYRDYCDARLRELGRTPAAGD